MDSKEFKNLFDTVAKANDFERAFGGWFKESSESIIVLDLQKSNFGDYYELNIKIFVQGIFGNKYTKSRDLVRKHTGDIFTPKSSSSPAITFNTNEGPMLLPDPLTLAT